MAVRHRLSFAAIVTKREPDVLAPLAIVPPAWTVDALCPEVDPEIFFPDRGGSTKEARSICARCSTTALCLEYALSFERTTGAVQPGVYGGLSPMQRRRLLRRSQVHLNIPCPQGCGRMLASKAAVGRHRRSCDLAPKAAS
jgi:WhiB family redox-sensing transcriptional regulator